MKRSWIKLCRALEIFALLTLVFFSGSALAAVNPPKILILYSAANNAPGQQELTAGFNEAMSAKFDTTGNVYYEYLDIVPAYYPGQRADVLAMLKKKYSTRHLDLIVTVFNAALDFLVDDASSLSPNTPAIAMLGRPRQQLFRAGRPIHQVPLIWDLSGTVDRALELFPNTTRLLFVSGATEANLEREKLAQVELARFASRLTIEYTSHLTMPELLEQTSHLPNGSIILYSAVAADAAGNRFVPKDVAYRISATANAPMFSYVSSMLDVGIVGGMMLDFRSYGQALGKAVIADYEQKTLALGALNQQIKPVFDWRQIQRWNANLNALPPNSVFLNRPESLWVEHQREILVASAVAALLVFALILALLQVRKRHLAELEAKNLAVNIQELKDASELHLTQKVLDRTLDLEAEIDRRTEAENQARASEFQYRLMADNSLDILWKWNVSSQQFIFVSSAIQRQCGIPVEDFLSWPLERIFSNESAQIFLSNILTNGASVRLRANVLELAIEICGREPLWTETLMTVLRNPVTEEDEIVGVSRDISLKKRALEEQRQFFAMVSHEFRNPLGTIRVTAEHMAERSAKGIAPHPSQYRKIEQSVDWLTDLMDEFFSDSRLALGSPGVHRADIDLIALLNNVVQKAVQVGSSHRVEVHTECWHGRIAVDGQLLSMALLTLTENAIKHTPPGTHVELSAYRTAQGGAEITVTDDGPGIPVEDLPQIGNKFFRSRVAQSYSGSGLGVYMARKIVQSHGGTLTVSNRPEGGACFRVQLPPLDDEQR